MLTTREVVLSLYGAWRLAERDPGGLAFFDSTTAGARRSFFAAAMVAPLYALMVVADLPVDAGAAPLRFALVQVIAYVTSWVAYPVVVEALSRAMGCREHFESYLTAYNWSMVLQNAVVLPLAILTSLDVLPPQLAQILRLAVFVLVLAYLGFIARVGLRVSPLTALGLVVMDVLLSALIDGIASGMELIATAPALTTG